MNAQRYLLYIGTLFIVVSLLWTVIVESRKECITEKLIAKGLPTPMSTDAFRLQEILDKSR
jgi:hypothetical protein